MVFVRRGSGQAGSGSGVVVGASGARDLVNQGRCQGSASGPGREEGRQ